jgi:hypothetical protein
MKRGELEVSLVVSELNDGDCLTKPLPVEPLSRASARVEFLATLHEER